MQPLHADLTEGCPLRPPRYDIAEPPISAILTWRQRALGPESGCIQISKLVLPKNCVDELRHDVDNISKTFSPLTPIALKYNAGCDAMTLIGCLLS